MTPTFYFLGVWKSARTWSQHYHTLDGDGDGTLYPIQLATIFTANVSY